MFYRAKNDIKNKVQNPLVKMLDNINKETVHFNMKNISPAVKIDKILELQKEIFFISIKNQSDYKIINVYNKFVYELENELEKFISVIDNKKYECTSDEAYCIKLEGQRLIF